jgi:hypothetical protein
VRPNSSNSLLCNLIHRHVSACPSASPDFLANSSASFLHFEYSDSLRISKSISDCSLPSSMNSIGRSAQSGVLIPWVSCEPKKGGQNGARIFTLRGASTTQVTGLTTTRKVGVESVGIDNKVLPARVSDENIQWLDTLVRALLPLRTSRSALIEMLLTDQRERVNAGDISALPEVLQRVLRASSYTRKKDVA